jgi:hypothetical protein
MKKLLLFCVLALGCAFTGNAQLTPGLIACYPLNQGIATDEINGLDGIEHDISSAQGHNGTVNGASSFTGLSTSYVELPDTSLLKTPSLSISLWVKPISGASAYVAFTSNNAVSNFEGFAIVYHQSMFRVDKNSSSSLSQCMDTTTRTSGVFYHICATGDNDSIQLFVNGVRTASAASPFAIEYGTGKKIILGGSNESFNLPFEGVIDDLRFYDRVLSGAEVADLYTSDPSCIQTSSQQANESIGMTVFPNPASTKIGIEVPKPTVIAILNALGQERMNRTVANGETIDVTALEPGIYFVRDLETGTAIKFVKD